MNYILKYLLLLSQTCSYNTEGLKGGAPSPNAGPGSSSGMGGAGPGGFHYSGMDSEAARRLFEALFGGAGGGGGGGGFSAAGGGPGGRTFFFSSSPGGSSSRSGRGPGAGMFGGMFGNSDSDEEMPFAGNAGGGGSSGFGGRPDPFGAFGMGGIGGMGGGADPFASAFQQQQQYGGPFGQHQHFRGHPHQHQQPKQEVPLYVKLEDLYKGATKRLSITRHVADAASGKRLPVKEEVTVNITPGWKEGTKLTYAGLGDEQPGQPAADLVIVIQQQQHSRFHRNGNDLHTTVQVPLVTALTGGTASIEHLDGRQITLPIQQLTAAKTSRVIPGEGMPISKQPGTKGDLHVTFEVVMPTNLTPQQKAELKRVLPAR
jgi:DnaJ family protein B protein 4